MDPLASAAGAGDEQQSQVLDLTKNPSDDDVKKKLGKDADKDAEAERAQSAATERSSQEKAKNDTRKTIALWLVGLFCTIVVLSFTALFMVGLKSPGGFDTVFFDKLKGLLDVLVGPVITLLSSAIGFYFGQQSSSGIDAMGRRGA